jgi:large subunit ribosomal protein L28
MSRVCPVTGKGPVSGNTRSHSLAATRRRWNVNLQKYKVTINGKQVEVRMSARAFRSLNKTTAKAAEVKPEAKKAVVKEEAKVEAPKEEKAEVKAEKKPAAKKAAAPKKAEKPVEEKKEAK